MEQKYRRPTGRHKYNFYSILNILFCLCVCARMISLFVISLADKKNFRVGLKPELLDKNYARINCALKVIRMARTWSGLKVIQTLNCFLIESKNALFSNLSMDKKRKINDETKRIKDSAHTLKCHLTFNKQTL